MEVIKHTPFIWQYLDIASDREVDLIRATGENHLINNPNIKADRGGKYCDNNLYDLTSLAHKHPDEDLRNELKPIDHMIDQIFCRAHTHYFKNNKPFSYSLMATITKGFNLKFLYRHYDTKDSFAPHVDLDPRKRNILAGLLYLNDDFEGGTTDYPIDRLKVKSKKNSLLFSPVGPHFIHTGSRISKGEKHVVWSGYEIITPTVEDHKF
tara:strand:+ start:698 stop:1324 length:627 start_codon:yes stop_codon:yes gene_type:complete